MTPQPLERSAYNLCWNGYDVKPSQQNRGPRYRFNTDGKPICLRCDQPGHIARFCPAPTAAPQTAPRSAPPTQREQEN